MTNEELLNALIRLKNLNAGLKTALAEMLEERDAAVKILKKEAKDNFNLCYYCKHHSFDFCNDCDYEGSQWEWRGVQK